MPAWVSGSTSRLLPPRARGWVSRRSSLASCSCESVDLDPRCSFLIRNLKSCTIQSSFFFSFPFPGSVLLITEVTNELEVTEAGPFHCSLTCRVFPRRGSCNYKLRLCCDAISFNCRLPFTERRSLNSRCSRVKKSTSSCHRNDSARPRASSTIPLPLAFVGAAPETPELNAMKR